MLTREQLLGSFTRRYIDVATDVPSVGVLTIQNLNESELSEVNSGALTKSGEISEAYNQVRRRRWFVATVVGEDKKRLLDYSDVPKLAGLDAAVISAVFVAALKHCGQTASEGEIKNSEETPGSALPTA